MRRISSYHQPTTVMHFFHVRQKTTTTKNFLPESIHAHLTTQRPKRERERVCMCMRWWCPLNQTKHKHKFLFPMASHLVSQIIPFAHFFRCRSLFAYYLLMAISKYLSAKQAIKMCSLLYSRTDLIGFVLRQVILFKHFIFYPFFLLRLLREDQTSQDLTKTLTSSLS